MPSNKLFLIECVLIISILTSCAVGNHYVVIKPDVMFASDIKSFFDTSNATVRVTTNDTVNRIVWSNDKENNQYTKVVYVKNSPYVYRYVYDSNTSKLQSTGVEFYRVDVGYKTYYSENGKVIRTEDCEADASFKVSALVSKLKKHYHVDLLNGSVTRSIVLKVRHRVSNKLMYTVSYLSDNYTSAMRVLTIDAQSGKVLTDRVVYLEE